MINQVLMGILKGEAKPGGKSRMITLPSKVENQTFLLNDIEKQIKPLGYVIGGNWDYEHGYFDYKMEDNGSYLFVRVPFQAVEGELDQQGVEVKLGRPFLLSHKYQSGLDDWVDDESALVNQFSEPVDKDAPFPKEWIDTGRAHVHELEEVLLR